MKRFRPQELNKRWAIRHYRQTGHSVGEYNWQPRTMWYRDGDRNRKHQIRVFAQLHYLGSHAPLTIRKKWRIIEQRYIAKRMPLRASMRYLNTYSSGRYL